MLGLKFQDDVEALDSGLTALIASLSQTASAGLIARSDDRRSAKRNAGRRRHPYYQRRRHAGLDKVRPRWESTTSMSSGNASEIRRQAAVSLLRTFASVARELGFGVTADSASIVPDFAAGD